MKHNTHIYLAAKAIEFLYEGMSNLRYAKSKKTVPSKLLREKRASAKTLQRMLMHYQQVISEASWAPDDILNDKSQFHTFKLFTDKEFPGGKAFSKEVHKEKYYRAKGGGGLPYKVDHLSRAIADMDKLRRYNDRCSMEQIMYQYLMISHYIVDANVPMHCDLRDDPPSASATTKPRNGTYFSGTLHGKVEKIWEEAVNPVAIKEEIIELSREKDDKSPTSLSSEIIFNVTDPDHIDLIHPMHISSNSLMEYMIDLCISTKERSLKLFPIADPNDWTIDDLKAVTRPVFADTISALISVWMWIWDKS
jgi:hypothetical protein